MAPKRVKHYTKDASGTVVKGCYYREPAEEEEEHSVWFGCDSTKYSLAKPQGARSTQE